VAHAWPVMEKAVLFLPLSARILAFVCFHRFKTSNILFLQRFLRCWEHLFLAAVSLTIQCQNQPGQTTFLSAGHLGSPRQRYTAQLRVRRTFHTTMPMLPGTPKSHQQRCRCGSSILGHYSAMLYPVTHSLRLLYFDARL
jgi:hypothetical protein